MQCCFITIFSTSPTRGGSVAEWSKALVLGTSHFDGVGSNPTAAMFFPFSFFLSVFYLFFTFIFFLAPFSVFGTVKYV